MVEIAELIWRKDVIVADTTRLTVQRWLDGDDERITGRVPDRILWGNPTAAEIDRDVSVALGFAARMTYCGRERNARGFVGFAIEFRFERLERCRAAGPLPRSISSAITSAST